MGNLNKEADEGQYTCPRIGIQFLDPIFGSGFVFQASLAVSRENFPEGELQHKSKSSEDKTSWSQWLTKINIYDGSLI